MYKLQAENYVITHLPATTDFMEMAKFGNYWLKRDGLTYTTTLTADSNLTVIIPDSIFPPDDDLSLIINHGQNLNGIFVKSQNGWNLNYSSTPWEGDDLLITFGDIITAAGEKYPPADSHVHLFQNIPNPATGTTTIAFQLDASAGVQLNLYDIYGRLVRNIEAGTFSPGIHSASFSVDGLSPGVYVYILHAGNDVLTRKMMVEKQ